MANGRQFSREVELVAVKQVEERGASSAQPAQASCPGGLLSYDLLDPDGERTPHTGSETMTRAAAGLFGAVLLLIVQPVCASNWRYAGIADSQEPQFFDNDSIEHPSADTVRVWLESVPNDRLSDYYAKHERQLAEFAERRTASGYVPVFLLPPLRRNLFSSRDDFNGAVYRAVVMEAMANSGSVPMAAKARVEIDCALKRTRVVESAAFDESGALAPGSRQDTPAPWHDASIGSNGERLQAVFCTAAP
jgi:hypothetical protein